jgi:peptidylprolyl isomerase
MRNAAILSIISVALFACGPARHDDRAPSASPNKKADIKADIKKVEEPNQVKGTAQTSPALLQKVQEVPKDIKEPAPDAQKTASGLLYKVYVVGKGKEHPGPLDLVTVHYSGWKTDGTLFDSSVRNGKPVKFPLNHVLKGWSEGLQLMVVGEKRRLWIPANLAYGDKPTRPGAPAGMLVFDVELLDITKAPKVPEDVAAVPPNAIKTASGLAYRVLKKGTGKVRPKPESTVTVHYAGWTTDGKMFDSSITRGEPIDFPLNGVIKGWSEGVGLMVAGEKTRFWIPAKLAYGDKPTSPGAPAGMLVFEIELLSIK